MTISGLLKTAIEIALSTNTTVSCNLVDSTGRGISFIGSCAGTILRANKFYDHWEGLRLDGSAIIDPQQQKGNKWLGTYGSGYGAVNWNSLFSQDVALNEFTVSDPTPGTPLHPTNWVICSGCSWFVLQAGSYDQCTGSNSCNAGFGTGGDEELEELSFTDLRIAEDSLSVVEYEPETKAMAEQYLFDKLTDNDSLKQTEPVLISFYAVKQATETEFTNNAKSSLMNALIMDTVSNSFISISLSVIDSLSKIYFENLQTFYISNQNYSNLATVNQVLTDQVNKYRKSTDSLLASKQQIKSAWLDSLALHNNRIQSNELIFQNEKSVNEILLLILNDKESVTESQKQVLYSVAVQCPRSGGVAVFKARAMLKYYFDAMVYDDYITCSQQGYFRNAVHTDVSKESKPTVILKPNPAKDRITVMHNIDADTQLNYELTDELNRVLLTGKLLNKTEKTVIDVMQLSSGFYLFKIINGTKNTYNGKVILSK